MIGRLGKAERLFSRGQTLVKSACFEAALEVFEQALVRRPKDAGFHLHRALALSETGALSEACEVLQQAMALQPTNPVLPMFLGQVLFDHEDYGQARSWCERALSLNPRNCHSIGLYALTQMALGDFPGAYARLTQPWSGALTHTDRSPLPVGKGHRASVLRLSNADLQSRLLLIVETYLHQHPSQARTLFRQQATVCGALAASAQGHDILSILDRLCTRGVTNAKRLAIHTRSLIGPTNKASRLLRLDAEEAYYLGNLSAALSYYTRLLEQSPDHTELCQAAFEICYAQGEAQRALTYLRRILGPQADPQAMRPWQASCLGELLYQAGQMTEASRYLSQAASRGLPDYKVFYHLGLCHLRQGEKPQARRLFARAVRLLNPGLSDMRLDEMLRVHQALSNPRMVQQRA